jgi:hypothetical protein
VEKKLQTNPYLDPSEFPQQKAKRKKRRKIRVKKNEVSMQRLAFALLMSAAVLLMVGFALRCIIFRQFFFFTPRVSRDNEV